METNPAALGRRSALDAALERFHSDIDSLPAEMPRPSAIAQMIAVVALTAVVHRDLLPPNEFDSHYDPLQSIISNDSLDVEK
jgi:hypothetical protein